jgi:hypothetical protein
MRVTLKLQVAPSAVGDRDVGVGIAGKLSGSRWRDIRSAGCHARRMDHDDPVAATPTPAVVAIATPARRLRDAAEPLAMHAVWSKQVTSSLAGLGLDFLEAYVAGRAASLGEPVGEVVAATFAWFEPGLITGAFEAARSKVARAHLVEVRERAATASLTTILDGDDPSWVADRLADALEHAEGLGRPLFSGLRGRGRPDDPVQRLWWAADLVREHRGDGHVIVVSGQGLQATEMNILTELWLGYPLHTYSATRGWSKEQLSAAADALTERGWLRDGVLTASGTSVRADIETRTDSTEQTIVDSLDDDLDHICERLDEWGQRCIDAGAFTADVLKRAAG